MTIDDQDYTIPIKFHDRKIYEQYGREGYSLIYKKEIIRELLRQVKERQRFISKDIRMWDWEQSEKITLITVLEILNNDLSCLEEETIDNAEKMTMKAINKMAKEYQKNYEVT